MSYGTPSPAKSIPAAVRGSLRARIVADAEHAALDLETLERLVTAGEARGASVVIRIPFLDASLSRALGTGAAGVIVPRVESAADCAAIVRATRFPPLGARGLGAGRATDFGLDMATHRAVANDDLLVVAMIETSAGIAALDEIVAADGIDAIMIGPADLASSLGVAVGSEPHAAAVERIIAAALAAGRQVGIHWADAADAQRQYNRGVRLLVIATDVAFLAGSANSQFATAPPRAVTVPAIRREPAGNSVGKD